MRALSALRSPELSPGRPLPRWAWGAALGLLGVAALALRLGTVAELADLPTFRSLTVDAARYDALAREILAGRWLPEEPFDQAPLYPYFLALVYALTSAGPLAVRVAQSLLGAATVVLLAALTGRAFGRPAGAATGLLAAFHGPLVVYCALLWKPTLVVFLLTLVLWLLAAPERSPPAGRITAAGMALGAAGLLRENLLLVAPVLALVLLLRPGRGERGRRLPGRAAWGAAVLFAGAVALPLLPVVWANHRASGEWMLTSSQGGMNFYVGNSRQATGTYVPFSANSQDPEQLALDSRALAARLLSARSGRQVSVEELSRPASSRFLWRETVRQIGEAPGRWLTLLGKKTALFWNAYEIPDAEGWTVYRRLSAVLGLAVVGFGWLVPLAAVGLWPAFRRRRDVAWWLVAGAAGVLLSVLPFFVLGRYRLPVAPFLLPLAGLGLAWLGGLAVRRRWRPLAGALAAFAVAAALTWPPPFPAAERRQHEVALWFNLGTSANRLAAAAYDDLAAAGSGGPPAGRLHDGAARAAQAVGYFDRVLAIDPAFPVARVERAVARHRLGVFLAIGGRGPQARAAYDQAIAELRQVLTLPAEALPPGLAGQARAVLRAAEANRARLGS